MAKVEVTESLCRHGSSEAHLIATPWPLIIVLSLSN